MSTKNPDKLYKFIVVNDCEDILSSSDLLNSAIADAKNQVTNMAEDDSDVYVEYEIGVYKLVKIVRAASEVKVKVDVKDFSA